MTEAVQVALISGSGAVLVGSIPGIIAAFVASAGRKAAERAEEAANKTHATTVEVAHRIDGRMDELVATTRELAFAAGVKQQKDAGIALAQAVRDAAQSKEIADLTAKQNS